MEEKQTKNLLPKMLFFPGLLLFLALFGGFIFYCLQEPSVKAANIEDVENAVLTDAFSELTKDGTDLELKRNFGLLRDDYEELLYRVPVNFMDVEEFLFVKVRTEAEAETVKKAMEERLSRQNEMFEDYGTDQYSVLKNTVIAVRFPYVYYIAGHEVAELHRLVKQETEE